MMPEIKWIEIPAGVFLMGSDPRDAVTPLPDEMPLHRVELPAFRIGRVPVTNQQYARFVAAGHPAPAHWQREAPPESVADLPVTYVSRADAEAFCTWAGGRLPSETEWEKSARGPAHTDVPSVDDTRLWPWGDALPDATRCHFDQQRLGITPSEQRVNPVGLHRDGASPYGVLDLAGNVWEWTSSPYSVYPWIPTSTGQRDEPGVVRGGSYNHDLNGIRCAARTSMASGARDVYIGFRLAGDGDLRRGLHIDMIDIPAGPFWMGSTPAARSCVVHEDELPRHPVDLGPFLISQSPVTNRHFLDFVLATGHPAPPHWTGGNSSPDRLDHPVTFVDWHDATAFAEWAGSRLPTEAEWERAAAGTDHRLFPWGNEPPDASRIAPRHAGSAPTTSPVGAYPDGATPEGVLDMAGNVWEWVQSRYGSYPYNPDDGRDDQLPAGQRVLRGGSFLSPSAEFVRCAMRSLSFESRRREHIGFRLARSISTDPESPEQLSALRYR